MPCTSARAHVCLMIPQDPQVDCYQMSRVQAELGLSRETLVGLAVFLGCDYIPKVWTAEPRKISFSKIALTWWSSEVFLLLQGVAGVGKEQTLKLIQSLRGQTLLQKYEPFTLTLFMLIIKHTTLLKTWTKINMKTIKYSKYDQILYKYISDTETTL